METVRLNTDILVIGGGTAGCWAAITIAEQSGLDVLICEKAGIKRSGCLAAGVNALNAYITEGKTPQDYADYCEKDAAGIVRGDLLLTMSERLNSVTEKLERLGLVILKDEQGRYAARGDRNIKINGENIKPLIAAKAVIIATGGAAGLYRPNNPGFSKHKMWYPPFNTGAGYAMGILHGAEMTTFEMRFIALRCKDTIAPTGTLAQGAGAKQINALGEVYEQKYGLTTSERVYGTVMENLAGRGPCYLRTKGISREKAQSLEKAYLNMAPSQTLKWLESGVPVEEQDVEIEGTEPYIVGGHTASGFWVDTARMTTIPGLFAAGDVSGGAPQKYVTGALAEGEIAGESAVRYAEKLIPEPLPEESVQAHINETEGFLSGRKSLYTAPQLEEAMQTVMDKYAGGIGASYRFTEAQLDIADRRIAQLFELSGQLSADSPRELLRIYELRERLVVCRSVIAHLRARQETRWHCFAENLDWPERNDRDWRKYVNSRLENGKIRVIFRELISGGETYEHSDKQG